MRHNCLLSQKNSPITIVRMFNTTGSRQTGRYGMVLPRFIQQALHNEPITVYGNGTQTRSLCYVSDLVAGLKAMGEKENLKGQIINLGNPNEKTILEIANKIKHLTSSISAITFQETDEDDPKKRKPDISKAKQLLSWEPHIEFADGLTKTIEYFKSVVNS